MIENDIRKLDDRVLTCLLDSLEADIWAGVATRTDANRRARLLYSCQTVVLALGLIGSVAAGTLAASSDSPNKLIALAATPDLAPSSRLIGH